MNAGVQHDSYLQQPRLCTLVGVVVLSRSFMSRRDTDNRPETYNEQSDSGVALFRQEPRGPGFIEVKHGNFPSSTWGHGTVVAYSSWCTHPHLAYGPRFPHLPETSVGRFICYLAKNSLQNCWSSSTTSLKDRWGICGTAFARLVRIIRQWSITHFRGSVWDPDHRSLRIVCPPSIFHDCGLPRPFFIFDAVIT